ncbi:MAG: TRAP transporter small permease subunit [Alphaproteobacteria bacterium]|nr:TRAP transporter small permease subunit [Alphaproteobacteria bacterium]
MSVIRLIDRFTGTVGGIGAGLVVPLFLIMGFEVFMRFLFNLPTFWAYELAYMITGAHFVLGIAYVTKRRQHVRIDFLYSHFPPQLQAAIDCIIYCFFLLPVSAWITWRLGVVALEAYSVGETSGESAWNPVIWPVRTVAAFGFFLFTLQVLAEGMRTFRIVSGQSENVE